MPLIQKARTGSGLAVQIIGGIIFAGCGLVTFIWELYVLFDVFGVFALLIALIFAPITYFFAILVVWFSTGIFPVIVLILWLGGWLGMGIIYIGSLIKGEEDFYG